METESRTLTQEVGARPTQVNILLVDDEPANLLALEAVLGGLGQRLVRAGSGKEALRCLIKEEFALILMDVAMPDMDGFETARLIRERDKTRLTPIIFLTAVGKSEHEIFRGYEVGAVDYLLKPLVPEILKSKVMIFIELFHKTDQIKRLNEELRGHAKEMEAANQDLRKEIAVRERVEQELRLSEEKLKNLNALLEDRVAERTAVAEEKARDLARSNAELQQFVHAASHDLKEPLRTITSYVQLLQRMYQNKLDGESGEYVQFVVEGTQRLQQLIDDLLSYTRLGADTQSPQPVDLSKTLQEALKNLEVAIGEKGAKITQDPLPVVKAHPPHMMLLFLNLLGNALKFHGPAPPKIHVSARLEENQWVLGVSDNGIGIHPKYFEKLFVVFQRLHTRDEYPGTGIGLALCRKIVEGQGGRIWVESEPGKGATFYFTVPNLLKAGG
jgi:two-component system, sensor histidine kinase and response regulator